MSTTARLYAAPLGHLAFDNDLFAQPFAAVGNFARIALEQKPAPPVAPLPGPVDLYVDDDMGVAIHHNDVNQGDLGDCYLVAAMAAVARSRPDIIANAIRENRDGSGNVVSYTVTLWEKESTWFGLSSKNRRREITVDANFPLNGRSGPGDVVGGRSEIWPMVIEKAYAQMRGGYGEIGEGGNPADALFALTGRDARSVGMTAITGLQVGKFQQGPTLTWDSLKRDFEAGKMITFSTKHTGKKDSLPHGLVGSHAYTVTGFHVDASGRKWVDLQNPWGYQHARVPFDELPRFGRRFSIGA